MSDTEWQNMTIAIGNITTMIMAKDMLGYNARPLAAGIFAAIRENGCI